MPLKARSALLLQDVVSLASPSICPSCELKTSFRILKYLRSNHHVSRQRFASTLASTTAINAPAAAPPAFQELHRALERLKRVAPNYVNLSRLQLALRSLESTTPVTRIAILGLQSQKSIRRLARLLLADALSNEGAWEKKLEQSGETESGALLLRYGDEADPPTRNTLVPTIHVPSRILQRHNLEILLSTITLPNRALQDQDEFDTLKNNALVPAAEAPKSFSGGIQFITYPVHRALILAEGLPGLLGLARYTKVTTDDTQPRHGSLLKLAVQYPPLAHGQTGEALSVDLAMLDLDMARQALDKFRESTANASVYEQGWNQSGLPAVSSWFSIEAQAGNGTPITTIPKPTKELISDLLTSTTRAVAIESLTFESLSLSQSQNLPLSDSTKQSLSSALNIWSLNAHTELRNELDLAFTSSNWARLKWWKLIWRVDDVAMITEELVRRHWLVEAEKGIIWLAGRAVEAGALDGEDAVLREWTAEQGAVNAAQADEMIMSSAAGSGSITPTFSAAPLAPTAPLAAAATLSTTPLQPQTQQLHLNPFPWPTTIPTSRTQLITRTIPSLQSLSQSLLLQTFSLTSLSSALSALLYVSIPGTSVYSVGAVAAFGLVWGMRRMQREWERARGVWADEVREEGRLLLKMEEERFRYVLDGVGRVRGKMEIEGEGQRREAELAVGECVRLLDQLSGRVGKVKKT